MGMGWGWVAMSTDGISWKVGYVVLFSMIL